MENAVNQRLNFLRRLWPGLNENDDLFLNHFQPPPIVLQGPAGDRIALEGEDEGLGPEPVNHLVVPPVNRQGMEDVNVRVAARALAAPAFVPEPGRMVGEVDGDHPLRGDEDGFGPVYRERHPVEEPREVVEVNAPVNPEAPVPRALSPLPEHWFFFSDEEFDVYDEVSEEEGDDKEEQEEDYEEEEDTPPPTPQDLPLPQPSHLLPNSQGTIHVCGSREESPEESTAKTNKGKKRRREEEETKEGSKSSKRRRPASDGDEEDPQPKTSSGSSQRRSARRRHFHS